MLRRNLFRTGLLLLAGCLAAPSLCAQPLPHFSASERKARTKALPPEDRDWLEKVVAPIITDEEKDVFLSLTEPYQREAFKQEFWKRRERDGLPAPFGPGYRERYLRNLELANDKYGGTVTDQGQFVLRFGEPDGYEEIDCETALRPIQIWTYSHLEDRYTNVQLIFYQVGTNRWRLWDPSLGERELMNPGVADQYSTIAQMDVCGTGRNPNFVSCPQACHANLEMIVSMMESGGTFHFTDIAKLLAAPKPSLEGLEEFASKWVTTAPTKGAAPIAVQGPGAAAAPATPNAKVAETTQGPAPGVPAAPKRKLTRKERKELTAALPLKYREWLENVDLIITNLERDVFLQIHEDYQRDHFIDQFWRRRSIDREGLRTDFREIYMRRVEVAREAFKYLWTDRAKIYLLNGPPDATIAVDCPDVYVPIQIWFYQRIDPLKANKVYLIFYQPYGMGEYKLWSPVDGMNVLYINPTITSAVTSPQAATDKIETCPEWRTVQGAIAAMTATFGGGAESMAEMAKLYQPPDIETEGVDRILSMTTDLATNSARIDLNQLVRFPDEHNNKIGVDVSLLVPRKDLAQRNLGDENFYNVDVVGEVVKGDRLLDNFKYRFDIPTEDVGGEKIPLTIRRYLYPGDYELRVKVSDDNRSAEGRIEAKLHVPDKPDAPPPLEAVARATGKATVDKALGDALPSSISLLPIARDIAVGLQRFETRTAEGIRAVDFYLDGTRVITRTRPPFDADLNLGPLPRKHTIRVVGYGPTGRSVGEDEMVINAGSESFRVKIISPPKGAKISGSVPVSVAVTTPEGKNLKKLEFYSNETRVATLYGPPYIQTVPVHESKNVGYLRVVATLDDGSVAEDLRYVNAPPYLSEVNVDAVELYTAVTEHGRPVTGLTQKNFRIFEDGKPQTVAQFEYVKNLPLTIGVGIDTSASMLESLPDAQKAAVDFLEYSMSQKDRGFTMSFDNEPYMLSKLTANKERLVRSLAGLRAEGSTALYDAIVYALYQFQGVKGKKALVILTDGKDTASKFDFDTLLDYVKKSGVSVYAIGLHIPSAELEVKYKLNKLAEATGGVTYYVSSVKNLTSIYRSINDELRSQYLLTYYSTDTSRKAEWRKVEVKMDPGSLHARTISGYYP
jgi:Ca-activated chloride channel homolog